MCAYVCVFLAWGWGTKDKPKDDGEEVNFLI